MSEKKGLPAALAAAGQQTAVLPGGLTVAVRPMPGRSMVSALFGTRFGSVDECFALQGQQVRLPQGTAHYLEHKKFESEQGDAFLRFAETGADADAYTGYDRTMYTVSAVEEPEKNLDLLLEMVLHPWFTPATVAKEQGIIRQEIEMYDDNPEWRMMAALCRCLYHCHGLRADIAGTVESIPDITPEMLYRCHGAFYRPEHMVLAAAGPITLEQVLAACARAGLDKPFPGDSGQRLPVPEPMTVCARQLTERMAVAKPCFGVGFKERPLTGDVLRQETLIDLICECIAGGMTPLYRRLYDEGLVNPGFDSMLVVVRDACCILFTGESDNPDLAEQLLRQEILRVQREGVDPELFRLSKKMKYGELLDELDNAEDAAGMMADLAIRGRTVQDQLEVLGSLTPEEANAALKELFDPERSASVRLLPA